MHKLGGYRMTKLRDDTGAIVMQHHAARPDPRRGHAGVHDRDGVVHVPAGRPGEDIAADSGADVDVVRAVMESALRGSTTACRLPAGSTTSSRAATRFRSRLWFQTVQATT